MTYAQMAAGPRHIDNMCNREASRPRSLQHNTLRTPLLSVNSVCSNDSVGLVGVRSLIYLHANINIRGAGSPTGSQRRCLANLLSFRVTARLNEIAPRSGGGESFRRTSNTKVSHKQASLDLFDASLLALLRLRPVKRKSCVFPSLCGSRGPVCRGALSAHYSLCLLMNIPGIAGSRVSRQHAHVIRKQARTNTPRTPRVYYRTVVHPINGESEKGSGIDFLSQPSQRLCHAWNREKHFY